MHLDIEPEPDGLLETGEEFISWFEEDLLPLGANYLSGSLDVPVDEAERIIRLHLNLCYDICHFAIGFEPHREIIRKLSAKGIKVGKIQISAALKASFPGEERSAVINSFSKFDEPTYLHQVVAKCENGQLIRYPDLPEALADGDNPAVVEWRAHFHVPVFADAFNALSSTQKDIEEVLMIQHERPFTNHLEVETYTWEVLPDDKKLPVNQSIIRELEWVKGLM